MRRDMKVSAPKPLEVAATKMRALSLSTSAGAFIGREEELVQQFGVARATLRQAARLLEREGVLHVRRGVNGGYFAARPNPQTIEGALRGYLDTQRVNLEENFLLAYLLWCEAITQAVRQGVEDRKAVAEHFRRRLKSITGDAMIVEPVAFEGEYRRAIFALARLPYLGLFFELNRSVSWRYRDPPSWGDGAAVSDPEFTRRWMDAREKELSAIEAGDESMALAAAKLDHEIWRERLFDRGIAARSEL